MSSRASYCRLVILVAATSLLAGAGFAVMLWGGTLFGEGPCEVYSDSSPQRAFCALARQHKPAHLAAYIRGRSNCEWKHLPALATKWRADIDSKNLYVLQKSSLKKPLQVCHFDAPGHGKWTLYRLGPFDTTGAPPRQINSQMPQPAALTPLTALLTILRSTSACCRGATAASRRRTPSSRSSTPARRRRACEPR